MKIEFENGGIQNLQFDTVQEEEEFYGELNRMEDSPIVKDPDLF